MDMNERLVDMENYKIEHIKPNKKDRVQRNFQLTVENARYLARIKYEKGIKYSDLMKMILDEFRENNYIR